MKAAEFIHPDVVSETRCYGECAIQPQLGRFLCLWSAVGASFTRAAL